MNVFAWILVAWFTLGAFVTIATIGKPKPPVTPGVAMIVVIFNLILIGLVLGAVFL